MGRRPPRGGPTEVEDDLTLVMRALVEPLQFEPLYRRYLTRVYRYCWSQLGDQDDANDATSETMHNAFKRLASFRGGSFEAWLIVIARNACNDLRRKRAPGGSTEAEPELLYLGPSPEEEAVTASDLERLERALRQLPARQAEIVRLHLRGFKGSEIARMLGVSHDLVRQEQHRALERLALLLNGEEGRDG